MGQTAAEVLDTFGCVLTPQEEEVAPRHCLPHEVAPPLLPHTPLPHHMVEMFCSTPLTTPVWAAHDTPIWLMGHCTAHCTAATIPFSPLLSCTPPKA